MLLLLILSAWTLFSNDVLAAITKHSRKNIKEETIYGMIQKITDEDTSLLDRAHYWKDQSDSNQLFLSKFAKHNRLTDLLNVVQDIEDLKELDFSKNNFVNQRIIKTYLIPISQDNRWLWDTFDASKGRNILNIAMKIKNFLPPKVILHNVLQNGNSDIASAIMDIAMSIDGFDVAAEVMQKLLRVFQSSFESSKDVESFLDYCKGLLIDYNNELAKLPLDPEVRISVGLFYTALLAGDVASTFETLYREGYVRKHLPYIYAASQLSQRIYERYGLPVHKQIFLQEAIKKAGYVSK